MVAIGGGRVGIIIIGSTSCSVGLFQNIECGAASLLHTIGGGIDGGELRGGLGDSGGRIGGGVGDERGGLWIVISVTFNNFP